MEHKAALTRKDALVALGCLLSVLASLGAVGSGGRRRAKEAVCLSNLQDWGLAWHAFLIDNDGLTPEGLSWWPYLWPYFKNEKLLVCPEAARPQGPLPSASSVMGGKFNASAEWYDYRWIFWENVPPPGKHRPSSGDSSRLRRKMQTGRP
ncbi:MAG: hypothetical protein ACYS76_05725 [Planctomycetota bacterium]